jgi:hypothetical protein
MEAVKMYQDTLNHMTTFSSGALVVSATVVGALFSKPDAVFVLALAFIFFLFGAAAAMLGLYYAPGYLETGRSTAGLKIPFGISVGASYFGVLLFALFAFLNFLAVGDP